MLKHTPSGTAINQQQQQQQQQHQQHQQQHQKSHGNPQIQPNIHQIPQTHSHHVHPKHPPPAPPQIQNRPNITPISRAVLNRSIQPLNISTISHQTLPSIVLTPNKLIPNGHANGGLRIPMMHQSILNTTPSTSCSSPQNHCSLQLSIKHRLGAREALTSLGLLCLVSLLLALLSLIFLLKISPNGREPPPPPGPISSDDYIIVYDVTLALCALSLSLNLCCLLVCAIQFLFAVKLLRAPPTPGRGNKYLQKSSVSRVCAVGGFFISIPIFLTGIILYTFTQFHSTPAIITSVLIGFGILFCGCAMVHNVFVWQREKTICVRNQNPLNLNLTAANQQSTGPHQTQQNHQQQQQQQQQQTPISATSSPQPIHPNLHHSHSHHLYQNHNGIVNQAAHLHLLNHHNNNNNPVHANHNHTPLTHTSQLSHTTPVTPLSANHSHISFLPGLRPATATPPTPKTHVNGNNNGGLIGREVSGSITPGTANGTGTLDISNVTSTISPHELSTLV